MALWGWIGPRVVAIVHGECDDPCDHQNPSGTGEESLLFANVCQLYPSLLIVDGKELGIPSRIWTPVS